LTTKYPRHATENAWREYILKEGLESQIYANKTGIKSNNVCFIVDIVFSIA